MAEPELQEQYDLLYVKYTNLLRLAEAGLKSCATCKGAGTMTFGLVTDKDREIVKCDNCGRPELRKFIEGGK